MKILIFVGKKQMRGYVEVEVQDEAQARLEIVTLSVRLQARCVGYEVDDSGGKRYIGSTSYNNEVVEGVVKQ